MSKNSGRNRPGRVRGSKTSPSVKLHRPNFVPAPRRPPIGPISQKAWVRAPITVTPPKLARPDDRRMRQPDGKKPPPKRLDGRPAKIIHSRAPRREGRIFRTTAQKKRVEYHSLLDEWHRKGQPGVRPRLEKADVDGRNENYRFVDPKKVWVCVKRKVRREVLHALKYTGRGHGHQRKRPPNYNSESAIHC